MIMIIAEQTTNPIRCGAGETLVEVLEVRQDVQGPGRSWMDNMEIIGNSR